MPVFWFPDQVNQWGPVKQDDPAPDTKPKSQNTAAPVIEARTISTVAKKAAQKRHEPVNRLKKEFVAFYEKGKFRSRADAARQFHASLPKDKQRLILKDNAARTLTAALPKLLRSEDKD